MIQSYLENKAQENKICISMKSIGIMLIIINFIKIFFFNLIIQNNIT